VAYPNCGFEYQASEGDEETQQGTQCSQTQGYTPNPHDSLQ
jgi:rubredoxin